MAQNETGRGVVTRQRANSSQSAKTQSEAQNIMEKQVIITEEDFPKCCEKGKEKWTTAITKLNGTLSSLQHDIKEIKESKGTVISDSVWQESASAQLIKNQEKLQEQEFKINLLTNIVIRQEARINELEGKITASYAREIKVKYHSRRN